VVTAPGAKFDLVYAENIDRWTIRPAGVEAETALDDLLG
jgi:hypothetical protein